jgi:hypothetical protein
MFLKLQPIIYSIIFFLGLEFIMFSHRHVIATAVILLFFSIYAGKRLGGRWGFSTLPAFFSVSSIALLYLIALSYEQQIFAVLASAMYYLSLLGAYRLGQYRDDKTAKGMNMAATASTIFFTYASAYGLYLNFLVPIYILMISYLVVTLLVSYQHFSIGKDNSKRVVWIYSFIVALIMSELIWTMNFWPFGYLTTGVIALILYYVIWDVIQCYFSGNISKKRVVTNLVLITFLIGMILMSAKWIPVI